MNNNMIINRVFTQNVIKELIKIGSNEVYNAAIRRFINDPENKSNGEIISEIYEYISKENRNEYFYLNTLMNKLLVRRHNVNTTTALSQIWVGNSKADFIMINGTGQVYEIKSELDNFDRLEGQLRDYYKAFSLVTVVIAAHHFQKIQRILSTFGEIGEYVGLYALSEKDTKSKRFSREPKRFDSHLDHSCIFKLLRKQEYENIIFSYFGTLPKTKPTHLFRACLDNFREIPISTAQELAFKELKKRNRIEISDFNRIPEELKSIVYFSDLSRNIVALEQMLETGYRR